jgi:hypothetical protein
LSHKELADWYLQKLEEQEVESLQDFREARFVLRADEFVPAAFRKKLWALPASVTIRDREVEINYDVEEESTPVIPGEAPQGVGVARLRLPEKLARTLTAEELPALDRPLRFVVSRGSRGAVRAASLEELQELLEGPWTPNEQAHHPNDSVSETRHASSGDGSSQRRETVKSRQQKSRGADQGRRQSAATGRLRRARKGGKPGRRR